jgi:hypothetical protein
LAFEKTLDEFVIKDKSATLLKSVAGKTLRIIEQEILLHNIKLQSLHSSRQELEGKLSKFNSALTAIQKQQSQDEYLLKGETQTIVKTLEQDLENLKAQAINKLIKSLGQWYKQHRRESTKGLAKILDAYIGERLQDIFIEWKFVEEEKIKRLIEEALRQFNDRVNAVTEQILDTAAKLFNLSLDKIEKREQLSDISKFSFMLKDDVQVSLDTLSQTFLHLLPSFIGHKIVLKQMKEYTTDMVDRHCGRLRYDFVQRIDETQIKFKTHLRHDVQSLTNQIIQAIQLGQGLQSKTITETEQIKNSLQIQISKLNDIKQQLQLF